MQLVVRAVVIDWPGTMQAGVQAARATEYSQLRLVSWDVR